MQTKISKILKNDATTTYSFPVSYVDSEGTTLSYNVFTNEQFRQIVKQLFGNRIYNDWDDESDEAACARDFVASFNQWKATRSDTYGRRMYALSIKFEPLENYRSHEERSGSFTHGESVELSYTNRKDTTKDDSFIEKSYTNYKESTKDDSFVERSFDDYKETTKDDSFVTRSYDDLTEHETDDTYIERSYDHYKESTKDDSTLTRSYNSYQESTTYGEKTTTNKISADDSTAFVNSSQSVDAQRTDDKDFSGSYTDAHGYDTIGVEKSTSGTYKDQHGFDENGILRVTSGDYTDQHGQTETGVEKETSGSYKDQHGFDEIGNEKTISGSIKDQHGFTTNGLVNEKSGKETTTHSGTDEDGYTLERYGNIGVTTSQQMLASDLDLLKYDITMTAIREFISTYTYFSCEVE